MGTCNHLDMRGFDALVIQWISQQTSNHPQLYFHHLEYLLDCMEYTFYKYHTQLQTILQFITWSQVDGFKQLCNDLHISMSRDSLLVNNWDTEKTKFHGLCTSLLVKYSFKNLHQDILAEQLFDIQPQWFQLSGFFLYGYAQLWECERAESLVPLERLLSRFDSPNSIFYSQASFLYRNLIRECCRCGLIKTLIMLSNHTQLEIWTDADCYFWAGFGGQIDILYHLQELCLKTQPQPSIDDEPTQLSVLSFWDLNQTPLVNGRYNCSIAYRYIKTFDSVAEALYLSKPFRFSKRSQLNEQTDIDIQCKRIMDFIDKEEWCLCVQTEGGFLSDPINWFKYNVRLNNTALYYQIPFAVLEHLCIKQRLISSTSILFSLQSLFVQLSIEKKEINQTETIYQYDGGIIDFNLTQWKYLLQIITNNLAPIRARVESLSTTTSINFYRLVGEKAGSKLASIT